MTPRSSPTGAFSATVEELEKADSIVLAALDLAPEDRPAYVDRMCSSSPSLRREVESLLYLETHELAAWDQPAFQIHFDSPSQRPAADRIGPYQVIKELGRGGVATVYLARRFDDPDRRRLALKVLRAGFDNDDVVRSLQREGRILALLDHPYISRVFGGGMTEDQRPYLVMEYIEGETLDRYIRTRKPELQERLELFGKVCQAVEFAHSHLVVHRDIKPSNILVDESGDPHLLDFGISRLLDASGEQSLTGTATGRRMLTPAYASPEQVRNQPMTIATDVFSLGVVLYELLSGIRPLDLAGSEEDWRRVVCEQDPPLASQASESGPCLDAPKWRRRLVGDLDAIAAKALRKEPRHRYESVRAIRRDLKNYRAGMPVTARRGTVSYRLGKFVRRRRAGLGVAFLVLCLLGAFLVDRQRQLERVLEERDKAWSVRDFLVDLLSQADPHEWDGRPPTVADLLDSSYSQLDQFDGQPDLQATVKGALGAVYSRLGHFERGEELLSASLAWERDQHDSPTELAAALQRLASLEGERTNYRRSEALLLEALAMLRHDDPDNPEMPVILNDLGLMQHWLGDKEAAEVHLRLALTETDRVEFEDPSLPLTIRNNLGLLLYESERYDEAVEHFERLIADRRQRDNDLEVAMSSINLAGSYLASRDVESSVAVACEAHDLLWNLLGAGHPTTATAVIALAAGLENLGHEDEALSLMNAVGQAMEADGHGDHRFVATLALRSGRLLAERDPENALDKLRFAKQRAEAFNEGDNVELIPFLMALAELADGEEAQQATLQALEVLGHHVEDDHHLVVKCRQRLEELEKEPVN